MARISIQDVISKKLTKVWCINATKGKTRSQLVITVPKVSGSGLDTIVIPATFLPIDLTGYVSHKQIVESSEIRRALQKEFLYLIDNDEALKILDGEGVEQEKIRLRKLEAMTENLVPNNIEEPDEEDEKVGTTDSGVNMSVIVAMESLESDGEVSVLNSLRSMGELNDVDYQHVLDNAGDYKQLAKYAEKALAEVRA